MLGAVLVGGKRDTAAPHGDAHLLFKLFFVDGLGEGDDGVGDRRPDVRAHDDGYGLLNLQYCAQQHTSLRILRNGTSKLLHFVTAALSAQFLENLARSSFFKLTPLSFKPSLYHYVKHAFHGRKEAEKQRG